MNKRAKPGRVQAVVVHSAGSISVEAGGGRTWVRVEVSDADADMVAEALAAGVRLASVFIVHNAQMRGER